MAGRRRDRPAPSRHGTGSHGDALHRRPRRPGVRRGRRFHLGDVAGAAATGFDDTAWAPVSLPHTWNAADGGGNYRRDIGWYRTRVTAPRGNGRAYLQFDGANLSTDVFVDGKHAGGHEGGYSGFRVDVTEFVQPGRIAVVAVAVDNRKDPDVPPLDGDFTLSGGLYRDVHLLVTPPVHIDALDYGGPGVAVRQKRIDAAVAEVDATTKVTTGTNWSAEPVPHATSARDVVRTRPPPT